MTILHKIISVFSSWMLLLSPGSYFIEGVVGQPVSFLPGLSQNETDRAISSMLYRGLFKYDSDGQLVPDLAESWEISEDGLVYTITLKENQMWHDGSPITSDDLIYTSFNSPSLSGIATDRVSDKIVRFTLPNKYSPFLSLLTVGIMKVGTVEKYSNLQPVGSGEFSVLSINRSGPLIKEIVLETRNEESTIKKLAFRYYTNDEELEIAAKLGEITGFVSPNDHLIDNFKEYQVPLHGVYYALFFNLNNENLKELSVREDLRNVLPLNEIVSGYGTVASGPISESSFTDTDIDFQQYDMDFEKKTLGHKFRLVVPDIEYHVKLGERVKSIWENQLGVEIEIVKVASSKFNSEVIETRDFDILLYGQEVGRDPDRYIYWHSTQTDASNLNITGFSHVRADRSLEEGRNETDTAQRKIHYNEFQLVFKEQIPAIILYHPYMRYYISDFYSGITENNLFTVTDRFVNFDNWKRSNTN